MRAILIDVFKREVSEIDLPLDLYGFRQTVQKHLCSENFTFLEENITALIIDADCLLKPSPGFKSNLMKSWPLFGNVIWIGQDPITKEKRDLFHAFEKDSLAIEWLDHKASELFRKDSIEKSRQAQS
ncbi:hypothetical protein [Paraflavitalea sp. CAU 1676]|uniref:hypothetical protein n=1 Tax=Paraflavitalea sp. CAU 1676 TaxID=3032598 RepID=UPI0023DADC48|nr:hypothetical protein [Paraflavitalea sp. CAU 1676]MDF2191354.1 hypothetical protein [Paraflavitalea sp. CAU 1676]